MLPKLIGYIALLVCLTQTTKLCARAYPMQHYTIADGLPSNTIYDMYEDEEGLIWIGTDKGISRYNGLTFENFTTSDGLSDNECFYFRKDVYGRLWISTYNGELCFYKDGIFHNAKNTPYLNLPKSKYMRIIKILKDGSVAFFDPRDPIIFILDKNKFTSLTNSYIKEKDLYNDKIISISKIDAHKFKIYFAHETVILDSVKIFQKQKLDYTLQKSLLETNEEHFLTTENKILDENLNDVPFKAYPMLSNTDVVCRFIQSNIHAIVATNKGIFIDSMDIDLFNQVTHTIIINQAGDYWVGTKKNGLFILSKSFLSTKKINNVFDAPIMFATTQKEKLLFATSAGDLIEVVGDSSKLIFNASTFKKHFSYFHYFQLSYIGTERPRFEGNLKFFLFRQAFKTNKQPRLLPIVKSEINIDQNYCLTSLKSILVNDSFAYFNSRHHLSVVNRRAIFGNLTKIYIPIVYFTSVKDPIFGFTKGAKNDIWVSTLNAVFKINDTVPIVQPQFRAQSFRELIYLNKRVIGISHTNDLIICSNIESKRVHADTVKATNCIWEKFYNLNDTTVLISTNNYLRVLTLSSDSQKLKYAIKVIENPFIPYSSEFIYTDSSSVYFFKNGAISSFPIAYLLQKQSAPKVYFKTLETDQGLVYIKDSLEIDYKWSKNMKLNISPVSFYDKELSYEYTLSDDNDEEKWTSFSGNELNLIDIGYGNFTIKIRAKTLSGEHSTPAIFYLIIKKPYWATWWFITTQFAIGTAVIIYIARLGVKSRLKKKEGEVRFLKSEYKSLNAMMNPHFIFNALNSVQSLVNNQEIGAASKYIRTFSDLIRQNMHNIAEELIPLSKELNLIENYLQIEKLRFKENLNYSIHIAENVEAELINVPPLLIQPLVENAIKHGLWPKNDKSGHLNIRVHEIGEKLVVEIKDNGVGLSNSPKSDTLHKSYAIENMHSRIAQLSTIHNIKIALEIKEDRNDMDEVLGTTVILIIQG